MTYEARTIEDLLELISSLQQGPKIQIHSSDVNFLYSIGRQVFKGTPLTDRQYHAVKEKLFQYKDQLQDCNFELAIDNLRMPLRQIDRSKYIKIVDHTDVAGNKVYESFKNDWKWIKIRFPFSKKLIILLDKISKQYYEHEKGSHIHYFRFNEQNTFDIVESFKNKEFEIDNELINQYNEILEMKNNKKDYVPGIYNFKLKNLNQNAIDYIISSVGEPNIDNLALFKDRKDTLGLEYFDDDNLNESIFKLSPLSQKIVNRTSSNVLVTPESYTFNTVAESLLELNRFPLLVLLNESSALDELHLINKSFNGFINSTESSVLFRLDNENNANFNNYVKDNNLNSPLDKSTKVVYINSNKVPKPLIKSDWEPEAMLLMSSFRLRQHSTILAENVDLVIHYDNNMSQVMRIKEGIQKL